MFYEHRSQPLLPRRAFLWRMLQHAGLAALGLGGSWAMGIAGYHYLGGLPWIDAVLNSAMLLGGMGPIDRVNSTVGKLFASFYALYAGLVFLIAAGLLFAPLFHRLLHRLNLEAEENP